MKTETMLKPKIKDTQWMKRVFMHLNEELTCTSNESPWLIWSQMLYKVGDEMRRRAEDLK